MRELTQEELDRLDQMSEPQSEAKFAWDDTFQRKLMGMLLTDPYMLIQAVDKVRPEYFSNEAHVIISRIVLKHFLLHKAIPEKWIIQQELSELTKERDKSVQLHYMAELHSVYDYYVPGLETREYLLDKITYFAKVQAVKIAFTTSLVKMNEAPESEETWNFVYEKMRQAMLIDRTYEPGLEYFLNIEEMFKRMQENSTGKDRFTSGFKPIDDALTGGGLFPGQIASWIAVPGVGKTHLKDTLILMFDGTIKKVQNVVVGDLVMGDDSTPRKVLATHSLMDRSYEIRPTKGDSYFVNSKHILSLKNSHRTPHKYKIGYGRRQERSKNVSFHRHPARMGDTNIFNISVEDWFKQSNHFKTKMKGWRTGVEFPDQEVRIDPYILGVWLGDGHQQCTGFTNADPQVVEAVYAEAEGRGLQVRRGTKPTDYFINSEENRINPPGKGYSYNTLMNDLRSYNLIKNKHIPQEYKSNSREVRLQLLAGLMDTDGSLCNEGFEISQERKTLADDIAFLARSLGFAAYVKECRKECVNNGVWGTYYRIHISGDCSVIPVRIPYKKAGVRKQIKDVLLTGIEVIDTGKIEEFFGFEVDGNHLFLLGDFTVVHNSLALTKSAVSNVLLNHRVLYLTMELNEVEVAQRFTAQFAKLDINNLLGVKDEVLRTIEDFKKDKDDYNLLHVKQFPGGVIDVNGIRAYMAQLELRRWKPNLLIIDYVGEMKDDPNLKKYESAYRILRDLRGFGVEKHHCTFTCVQPNQGAAKLEIGQYIDESCIGASFDQFKPLDAFWSINQQVIEKDAEVGRVFVIKHRNGRSRFPFKIGFDYRLGTLDMFDISNEKYREQMNLVQEKKADDIQFDQVNPQKKPRKKFQGDDPLDDTYSA